jgi:hypothetical protein
LAALDCGFETINARRVGARRDEEVAVTPRVERGLDATSASKPSVSMMRADSAS